MKHDAKEPADVQDINLYPPGMGAFLLGTFCMLATHTCLLLAIYALYVQPIPNHEESVGLIIAAGALSVFLVIHPSFLLTRAEPRSLRFLITLSTIYALLLASVCIWSLSVDNSLIYIAGVGLTAAIACRSMYRSIRMRNFFEHHVRLWNQIKESSQSETSEKSQKGH